LPLKENVFQIFPILCSKSDALKDYLALNDVQKLIHYPVPPYKQECY
jgi:hypothetical protein